MKSCYFNECSKTGFLIRPWIFFELQQQAFKHHFDFIKRFNQWVSSEIRKPHENFDTDLSKFSFALFRLRAEERHGSFTFSWLLTAIARSFHLPDFTSRNLSKSAKFSLDWHFVLVSFQKYFYRKPFGNSIKFYLEYLNIASASAHARERWNWFGNTTRVL